MLRLRVGEAEHLAGMNSTVSSVEQTGQMRSAASQKTPGAH